MCLCVPVCMYISFSFSPKAVSSAQTRSCGSYPSAQKHSGLKNTFHPQHRKRVGTHAVLSFSTVCTESFISLLGSVPGLKGKLQEPSVLLVSVSEDKKMWNKELNAIGFNYRQGQAQRHYENKACQYGLRRFQSCLVNVRVQLVIAKHYYVGYRVWFAK